MSDQASVPDTVAARAQIDVVARSWIGTPFHDEGQVKGTNGGCDCATLLKCVFVEAGVIEDFKVPHYSPQFFLHSDQQIYLEIVKRFAREIPETDARCGDIVLYWIGKCFAHGAIIIAPGWPHIVHAHYGSRNVRKGLGTSVHLGVPIKDRKFFTRW